MWANQQHTGGRARRRRHKAKTRGGSPATVSEYKYNGLGYRTRWHYDVDEDADVDSNDKWYSFFYDERWRIVATYRDTDSSPKERFIYHNAGARGFGGSSYIDLAILRDSDDSGGWNSASDGVLETRQYLLQNWRADVVAVIAPNADPIEYVRYSAYGEPFVYAAGDMNRDGVCDTDDESAWYDLWQTTTGTALWECDVNRDGAVSDSDDLLLVQDHAYGGKWAASGRGKLSRVGVRKGYAGYEWDPAVAVDHVRNRVFLPHMGKWGRRDPIGFIDGPSVYEYGRSSPMSRMDPSGLHCTKWKPKLITSPPNPVDVYPGPLDYAHTMYDNNTPSGIRASISGNLKADASDTRIGWSATAKLLSHAMDTRTGREWITPRTRRHNTNGFMIECDSRGRPFARARPGPQEKVWGNSEMPHNPLLETVSLAAGATRDAPAINGNVLTVYTHWRIAFARDYTVSPSVSFAITPTLGVALQWTITGDRIGHVDGPRLVGPWRWECRCRSNDGRDWDGDGQTNDDESDRLPRDEDGPGFPEGGSW